ncbi:tRNA-modifying protein YgfZ [hydrothermal vent metagenome]|uniref:tRNA-modifying protein YgfZ n=1 Tax=hydrothermal vent metagenome TaxID=652676 RepID=A0A3B0YIJ1_9ZZZZ
MIPDWKKFLENNGAEFDESGVNHYGNPRRELSVALTGNVFADLSHYGLISVHGEDAAEFLLGQFTNDLRDVDEAHSQYSGYCNAKGRLLATFRVFRRGDSYYLVLPADMLESLISKLRMFVLRAKVTLEDASDTFVHLGVSGETAALDLQEAFGALPAKVHEVTGNNEGLIIRVPGKNPGYEIFTGVDRATALWDALNVQSAPVGADAWQLLDIKAGIPVITPGVREAFVPQMANLPLVDGVSFRKGCYPGQEIVARMQYLGKLKRRMYLARFGGDTRPQPGDEVFPGRAESQSVGKIMSAAPHPDGGFAILLVLQIANAESDEALHLFASDGPALELEHLPYPFPSGE